MSESKFSKETFLSLLTKNTNGGIVIPIIQRSYTQGGRGNDEAIMKKGESFLQCLVDALIHNEQIGLDFIYGTTENGKIQPLDGQQRLTTLFLLHWYVAQKENRLDELVKKTLKKFSYETRASSRCFCDGLCDFSLLKTDIRSLPEIIEDQGWFLLSWKNDPSVLSMLGMLGSIHNKLNDAPTTPSLWDKFTTAPEQSLITFFYTPLEAFNLTDDLYIKMNARGKELTLFEKFKAAVEKKIDDGKWDADKSVSETFGNQMDNEWTDIFWHFRDKSSRIDRYVLRLFAAILIGHSAGQDAEKTKRLFNNPESICPDDFDKNSYDCLYETLNLIHSSWKYLNGNKFNSAFFWWGDNKQELKDFGGFFRLFIAHGHDCNKMTWQQLALFHGFCVYLRNNLQIELSSFSDWLYFVRNLLANGTIDDLDSFVSAKKRLDEMSNLSSDIYGQLESAAPGFAKKQIEEEIKKAKIYKNSPDAKPIIQEIENCNFCRGWVSFVFDCLDITDQVSDHNRLCILKEIMFQYLNHDDISNDFRRALLTIGDNRYYEFWSRFAHIPEGNIKNYGPLSHKPQYSLITAKNKDKDKADLRSFVLNPISGQKYLKPLLLRLCNGETLHEVIDSFVAPADMPTWKRALIKESHWMDKNYPFLIIDNTHAFLRQTKKAWYPEEILAQEDNTATSQKSD